MTAASFPEFEPKSRADWRRWLRANHARASGVWLVFIKGADRKLTYADSVEEALCYGWIDSTMRPIDARRYRQMFTPRKKKSTWSALNKRRIEALMASGKMAAPGLAKIEAAKADGSWTSLDAVEALVMPPDFVRALAANKKAKAFFDGSAPSSRKGALHWINSVKNLELRAARIAHVVSQAAKGLRPAHQEAALEKARALKRKL